MGSLQNRTPAASPSFFNIHPHIFHRISFLHSITLHLNSMLSPTFLPRKIHPENLKSAMFVDAFLLCLKMRCSAYKTSISYADGKMRRTANAPAIIRNCKILLCLFAELRINSFYGELICTQMRDCRLTNPQVAYKTVRFFHFALHRDGDAPAIIRKCEILRNPFVGLRINL